jgi:hypothetical protein
LQVRHQGRFVGHNVGLALFHAAVLILERMSYNMPTILVMADMCFVGMLALGRGLLTAAHAFFCSA